MLESCYESSETVPSVESEQSFLRSIYDIVSSPTIWGSLEEEEVSVDSNTKSNPIGVSQVTRPMGCDVYMIKMDDKGSSFVVHTNVTTIDEFIQILSPNKLMS